MAGATDEPSMLEAPLEPLGVAQPGEREVARQDRNPEGGQPEQEDRRDRLFLVDTHSDQPPTSAASAAPSPPGVGAAVAMADPIRYTAPIEANRRSMSNARAEKLNATT